MALVNKPDESIFASSAKQGEVDNFPDLLRGWGITFEQTQGIPPMEWFNFLFKRLDEKHTYLMQRGLPEWSATQDYTKGSCVQFDGVTYRALKNSKNNSPNESNSQYWVRWGFALSEIARATLTQYGLTQLYTGYNSQREDLALTPKTAYQLKQLIDSNTRSLGNFIPNSKKSSAVNSNSADTVATSAAAKTAYDKGVEAKNAADNAQRTANDGVAKANAAQNSADNAQRSANDGINRANNAQNSANDGINRANNAQQTAETANRNVNTRVAKAGDTMSGPLSAPNINTGAVSSSGYLNLSSKNGQADYLALMSETGFDIKKVVLSPNGFRADNLGYGGYGEQYRSNAPFEVQETGGGVISNFYPFVKGKVMNTGNNGAAFAFGYTTKQPGYYEYGNFGRGVIHLSEDNGRYKNWEFEHTGTFRSAGDVITGNGNSVDWYTHVLNSLIAGITSSSYSSHYQGADVFKIKQNRLMIIRMQIGVVNSSGDYYLPESFDGSASVIAIDSGGAVNPVGAFFKGGNSVYISVTKPTNVTVIAIGVKN